MTRSEYREMLNFDGPTQRDRIIKKSVEDQIKLAPVSPSYKDVTIDDEPRKLNIIFRVKILSLAASSTGVRVTG